MFFDRFDIIEAHYVFCSSYHEGQGSKLYARLSRMSRYFKPRPSLAPSTLSENGLAIYADLVSKYDASDDDDASDLPNVTVGSIDDDGNAEEV